MSNRGGTIKPVDKTAGWSTTQFNKTETLSGLTIGKTYALSMSWVGGGWGSSSLPPATLSGCEILLTAYMGDKPKNVYEGGTATFVVRATAETITATETVGTFNYFSMTTVQLN